MDACSSLPPPLSPRDALGVLQPYFEEVRKLFTRVKLTKVKDVRLECSPKMHDSPRHFAGCRDDGQLIVVAPELADLGEANVVAILAHEFGHAVDFLYPAEFVLKPRRDDANLWRAERRQICDDPEQAARWARAWQERDADVVELTADAIAEYVTGQRIGYVGPCVLQCFNRGQPRPLGLR